MINWIVLKKVIEAKNAQYKVLKENYLCNQKIIQIKVYEVNLIWIL